MAETRAKIEKFIEQEARRIVEGKGRDWEADGAQYFRYCSECDAYVYVDDFSGSDDCCDECKSA